MKIYATPLSGVFVFYTKRYLDEHGFFCDVWNIRKLKEAGIILPAFVQDNHSLSYHADTVRGLHLQLPPHAQGKLVRCSRGRLFDVAVDVRRGSPSYGAWFGIELSFENGRQMWIPPGFLHGFASREPDTEIAYKCTNFYEPKYEAPVRWDSLALGIDWALSGSPHLSSKDASAPDFAAFDSPFVFGEVT